MALRAALCSCSLKKSTCFDQRTRAIPGIRFTLNFSSTAAESLALTKKSEM